MDRNLEHLIPEGMVGDCWFTRRYIIDRAENTSFLNDYYKLRFGGKLKYELNPSNDREDVILHLLKCEKCKDWLDKEFPEELVSRPYRLGHYCCASIFVAVEEYKERRNERVFFSLWRGEDPCWSLGGWHIQYCPWCSEKLPNKPFRKNAPSEWES